MSKRVRRKLSPIKAAKNEAERFLLRESRAFNLPNPLPIPGPVLDKKVSQDNTALMIERSHSPHTPIDKANMRLNLKYLSNPASMDVTLNMDSRRSAQDRSQESKDDLQKVSIQSQERILKHRLNENSRTSNHVVEATRRIGGQASANANKKAAAHRRQQTIAVRGTNSSMTGTAAEDRRSSKRSRPSNIQVTDYERNGDIHQILGTKQGSSNI